MADSDTLIELDPRSAPDLPALDALRVSALGKSGSITAQLKSLGKMSPEERASGAPKIHALREQVTDAIAARKAELEAFELEERLATERVDLSLPPPEAPQGTVHPVSQVMDELAEIFADLGFSVAEGPEIEDQWHNFTALNMPEFHPARAMQDTFYVRQIERRSGSRGARASHPHFAGPDPDDDVAAAAAPDHRARAASTAPTATPRIRRCSTRSKGW
jgi:phenylalanyl-tRNA synthetase alpha chain